MGLTNQKIIKIKPEGYLEAIRSVPGVDATYASRVSGMVRVAFPDGITKAGIILASTLCRDPDIHPTKIKTLTTALESSLCATYGTSLTCPVCQRKKKTCSEKEITRLKQLAKQSKNRISLTKPIILVAIKEMPGEFTANDLYRILPTLKKGTIRSILTQLRKEKEFEVTKHVWSKTASFGASSAWELLKDPRAKIHTQE